MTATVERIKNEIRALAPEEVEELLRDLQREYAMPPLETGDEAAIEAEWDAEIARRVQEIEEGKVELISGEESDRLSDALFVELGIERPARRA